MLLKPTMALGPSPQGSRPIFPKNPAMLFDFSSELTDFSSEFSTNRFDDFASLPEQPETLRIYHSRSEGIRKISLSKISKDVE